MRYFMLFVFLPRWQNSYTIPQLGIARGRSAGSGKSGTLDLVLGKFRYMFRFLYAGNASCQSFLELLSHPVGGLLNFLVVQML